MNEWKVQTRVTQKNGIEFGATTICMGAGESDYQRGVPGDHGGRQHVGGAVRRAGAAGRVPGLLHLRVRVRPALCRIT